MPFPRPPIAAICWAFLASGLSATASAQTPRVGGPFAGLFGGDRSGITQSLDLRGSLFGLSQRVITSADDAAALRALDPRFEERGTFGGASGSLDYSYRRHSQGTNFFVTGAGAFADYSVQPDEPALALNLGTGLSTNLTTKIVFTSAAGATYSPFVGLGANELPTSTAVGTPLVDTTIPGTSFLNAGISSRNVNANASVGLTDNLTKRSSLAITGTWWETYLLDQPSNDVATYTGAVTYTYRLTRTLSAYGGYQRSESRTAAPGVNTFYNDGYNLGLNYGDALTFSLGRRTTVTVAPLASVQRWNGNSYFRVNGSAAITHGMGRTWSAVASYIRDVGFTAGFREPVLSDSVNGSFGGLLLPRVRWSSTAMWSRGEIGFNNAGHFTTYTVSSSLSFALARQLALYAQYAYYRYHLPPGSSTLTDLSRFARDSVSVGLTTWLPIFNTGRSRT